MRRYQRLLQLVLWLAGGTMVLAIVAVFMPRTWIVLAHDEWLDFGQFPEAPIVEYLARALSGFYAMVGGFFLLAAGKPRQYAVPLRYFVVMMMLLAVAMVPIGSLCGMPLWWTLGDAASMVSFGVAVIWLQHRIAWGRW